MTETTASEKVPFLLPFADIQERKKPRQNVSFNKFIFLQTGLILLYTAISLAAIRTFTKGHPAISAIEPVPSATTELRPHMYMNLNHNPFAGPPRGNPDIDETWRELLKNINIRVSKDELESTGQTSVDLPENGGYLAWFGAYHELHCLKFVRQWVYRDHYFPNITQSEHGVLEMHTDHCIEYLRQSAMCHADTSLTVFRWDEHRDKPVMKSKRAPHMCRDWEAVEEVARQRSIGTSEFKGLRNPLEKM
jgi:hypothetical protein